MACLLFESESLGGDLLQIVAEPKGAADLCFAGSLPGVLV